MNSKIMKNLIPPFLKKANIYIPVFIAIFLLLFVSAFIVANQTVLSLVLFILLLFAIVMLLIAFFAVDNNTRDYVLDLGNKIETVQSEILLKMPIGIIIFDEGSKVKWLNPFMQKFFFKKDLIGNDLAELDAELYSLFEEFRDHEELKEKKFYWEDSYFQVMALRDERAMYFIDVTHYGQIAAEASNNRIVIGNIMIDNYDESSTMISDRRKSTIDNFMMKKLSNWAFDHDSYIKRLDDDKFLLVTTYGEMVKMEEDGFDIVDTIRETTSKANFPLTISIGMSYHEEEEDSSLIAISDLSQANLDLALSRGGDQVVIKTRSNKARYYGGKTNPMEKRTHVRSRQIANTISTIFTNNDSFFVMGHDYPDMDAVGASLGIRRIAEMNGQTCYIILDESRINSDIERLLVELRKDDTISEAIISPKQAEDMIQDDSFLFVVDVHKPSITIAPDLIDKFNNIIIIDHHRKGEEVPENVLLEYIEPYASSACELITEFFEYQDQNARQINRIEATTMLAGIIVDSRNFSLRTGSRTFDAASYLKSVGADSLLIQHLLKEDLSDYIKRNHLVEQVEFIEPNMGIAYGEDKLTYDTVTAAQAADTLLSMRNIDASFVVFLRSDKRVGISARSLGNVNVQTIMEQLGGGGHLSNAATQISDVTVSEAVQQLKDILLERNKEDS